MMDFVTAKAEVFSIIGRIDSSYNAPPTRRATKALPVPLGPVVARYDYTNETGELLYQVTRHRDPKEFKQRRPDGRGGFIPNLEGVRQVPFNLVALMASEKVVICEGEKDCLNVEAKLGWTATTNSGGATHFRPELVPYFAGKHVVILPDNDDKGRKHGETVAGLVLPVAASVRVVNLPGLAEKGDVSDWLAAGGTEAELRALVRATPEWVPTTPEAEPEAVAPGVADHGGLITSVSGAPRSLLANALHLFRSAAWAGVIARDQFALRTVARQATPWGFTGPWNEQQDALATEWLHHQDVYVSSDVTARAIETVAEENGFDPLRDYLTSVEWDRQPRLAGWMHHYLGAPDNPYTETVGTRWAISAVARALRPGCKADHVPILEGAQGQLKSTTCAILGGEFYSDDISDLGGKDAAMQTAAAWIIELPELDALSRAEQSRVKAFVSRSVDRFRPPYGRRVVELPRRSVFIGTVNHSTYLRDETGARRFWPITVGHVKKDELIRDRNQLWAEARYRFEAGESWWIEDATVTALAAAEQSDRYDTDPWQAVISAWAGSQDSITVSDVLTQAIDRPTAQWTQADQSRVARCLRVTGWIRYQQRTEAGREWRYRRQDAE